MEGSPGPEGHNNRYRDYVDKAAEAHLAALQTFGIRGWTAKNGTLVVISEYEAIECSVRAFERFMNAIDRRNPTVMQLVLDYEPGSKNTLRMLRYMFKLEAYDMFREGGREIAESDLDGSLNEEGDGAVGVFEDVVNNYLELNPQADPKELFEVHDALANVVLKALEMKLLNKTRMFILLGYLQGWEDHDIAEEIDLEPIQVQRHLYKIREALKKAHMAQEKDDRNDQ